jgi:hypothetical protein
MKCKIKEKETEVKVNIAPETDKELCWLIDRLELLIDQKEITIVNQTK